MVNTKYGRQPFLNRIQEAGLTYRKAAARLGVPYLHFRHVGYGYVTPKYELRDRLVVMLDTDADELFTPESLAAVPHYGDKGRRLMEEAWEQTELTKAS